MDFKEAKKSILKDVHVPKRIRDTYGIGKWDDESFVSIPYHVVEEIEILCNMVIDSSEPNLIELNSAKAILKNLKKYSSSNHNENNPY